MRTSDHTTAVPGVLRRLAALIVVLGLVGACGQPEVGSAGSVTVTTGGGDAASTTAPAGGEATTVPGATTVPTTTVPSDGGTTPAEVFVDIYLIRDGEYAEAVTRSVAGPDVAAGAVRALLEGPTTGEHEAGLGTAVPDDALLLGVVVDGGVATVDLSREFEAGGGSFAMIGRLAQVVYTLTQFPTVERVAFRLDGEPVTVFSAEGITLDGPVGRDAFLDAIAIGPSGDGEDVWTQSDLPSLEGVSRSEQRRVVLVSDGDVLNVRTAAGVGNDIMGRLLPGVVVRRLGNPQPVGSSDWVQVETPAGPGWVNEVFLGAVVDPGDFASDPAVDALLDELSAVMAGRGDLRTVASVRGLYVAHHAPPLRFPAADLAGILRDPTTYKWPSPALDMSDPSQVAELPDRTFAAAVADRFVSAYDDTDTRLGRNTPVEAGNSRPPAFAIPFELDGFNYVAVHDPGDNPDYGGLDWTTWYVSIDYEAGEPKVVALTIDEWSP